tara:strand:+ start:271 stop:618 length:348 start_codon:yes stop_codon:yes gene_type:complete
MEETKHQNMIVQIQDVEQEQKEKQIKKIESGVIHDGKKYLYEQDETWDCLCLKCDKDFILHLTRVIISGSVLAFCMIQLAAGQGDNAFYSSTLSLILGAFLGAQQAQQTQAQQRN